MCLSACVFVSMHGGVFVGRGVFVHACVFVSALCVWVGEYLCVLVCVCECVFVSAFCECG